MSKTVEGEQRRGLRLVREGVEIELRQGGKTWRGVTTGLNEHGLGARLSVLTAEGAAQGEGDLPAIGSEAEIRFRCRALEIPPVAGRVLRQEGSWVPGYAGFVAMAFSEVPWADASLMREFVRWKEGPVRTSPAPQREWFVSDSERTWGPLTGDEVHRLLAEKTIRPEHMIWVAAKNCWVRLDESASYLPAPASTAAPGPSAAPSRPSAEMRRWGVAAAAGIAVLVVGLLAWRFSSSSVSAEFSGQSATPAQPGATEAAIGAPADGSKTATASTPGVATTGPAAVPAPPGTAAPPRIKYVLFEPYSADAKEWLDNFRGVSSGATATFGDVMTIRGTNAQDLWGRVHQEILVDLDRTPILEIDVRSVTHQGYVLLAENKFLPGGYKRMEPTIIKPGLFIINIAEQTGLRGTQTFRLEVGVTNEGAKTNLDASMTIAKIRLLMR